MHMQINHDAYNGMTSPVVFRNGKGIYRFSSNTCINFL